MITWNCDKDGEIKGQGCENKTDLVVVVVRGKAIFEEMTCESQKKEGTSQVRTGARTLENMQRLRGWK